MRTAVKLTRTGAGYQIEVGAHEGSYKPGPRSFIFNVRTSSGARQVLLDGKPLIAAAQGEKRQGWYRTNEGVAVRITDDGKQGLIQIR